MLQDIARWKVKGPRGTRSNVNANDSPWILELGNEGRITVQP